MPPKRKSTITTEIPVVDKKTVADIADAIVLLCYNINNEINEEELNRLNDFINQVEVSNVNKIGKTESVNYNATKYNREELCKKMTDLLSSITDFSGPILEALYIHFLNLCEGKSYDISIDESGVFSKTTRLPTKSDLDSAFRIFESFFYGGDYDVIYIDEADDIEKMEICEKMRKLYQDNKQLSISSFQYTLNRKPDFLIKMAVSYAEKMKMRDQFIPFRLIPKLDNLVNIPRGQKSAIESAVREKYPLQHAVNRYIELISMYASVGMAFLVDIRYQNHKFVEKYGIGYRCSFGENDNWAISLKIVPSQTTGVTKFNTRVVLSHEGVRKLSIIDENLHTCFHVITYLLVNMSIERYRPNLKPLNKTPFSIQDLNDAMTEQLTEFLEGENDVYTRREIELGAFTDDMRPAVSADVAEERFNCPIVSTPMPIWLDIRYAQRGIEYGNFYIYDRNTDSRRTVVPDDLIYDITPLISTRIDSKVKKVVPPNTLYYLTYTNDTIDGASLKYGTNSNNAYFFMYYTIGLRNLQFYAFNRILRIDLVERKRMELGYAKFMEVIKRLSDYDSGVKDSPYEKVFDF